jgi:hypothetical protein
VPRQLLIHEGVVGAIEIEHTAIAPHHVVEEELRLAAHGEAQLLVEVRVLPDVRLHHVEVGETQPLGGEARGQ